jgi:tetratricopeptide (TPR) repeat protein
VTAWESRTPPDKYSQRPPSGGLCAFRLDVPMPADRRPARDPGRRPARDPGRRPQRRDDRKPPREDRGPRDPRLPDDIDVEDLDPEVLNELRTLPEGLAEMVAKHLVAAQWALADDDVEKAAAHVAAARRRASRVAAVREASGIVLYRQGEYAKALNELRTARRMTGSPALVPMMADCERGLGRPERAIELLREIDLRQVDPDVRVEALLVLSGARADLDQIDAALVVLKVADLTELPPGAERARLQYGYAAMLERAGRVDEAAEWYARAEESEDEESD